MDHFGGLDVSVKETSICIVDDTGRIVKEVKVASEPAALLKVLGRRRVRIRMRHDNCPASLGSVREYESHFTTTWPSPRSVVGQERPLSMLGGIRRRCQPVCSR